MKKVDFREELKHLYSSEENKIFLVNVPPMNFLMVDGRGDPDRSPEFKQSIEALFTVSYVIKFAIEKSSLEIDYGVMPLEGLWWSESEDRYRRTEREEWFWSLMIMQPDYVHKNLVEAALKESARQKQLPALTRVRFDSYFEGQAVQVMHGGLFFEEGPTVEKLYAYIEEKDFDFNGKHHEIYLSELRRGESKRWRTIIRQPVKKKEKDADQIE